MKNQTNLSVSVLPTMSQKYTMKSKMTGFLKKFNSNRVMAIILSKFHVNRAHRLNMDQLLSFAVLALGLFVIVKNSSTANDVFNAILTAVKTNITNLFSSMGGF